MKSEQPGIKKLYYSIGEVSEITGLKQYVLRYWETEFKQLNPPKNRAGNRTYRQKDIDTILQIKELLYDQKFTIEGARIRLAEKKNQVDSETEIVTTDPLPSVGFNEKQKTILHQLKQGLQSILDIINE